MGLLFLLQTLAGGASQHYRAEISNFFGVDLARLLPFNIARTWHLQLAIFWVSTSYLAAGIFLAPMIAGREPRGQSFLAYCLLGALVIVVFGSLFGEYAGIEGWFKNAWLWFGNQGFEYLDLGRFWQILLTVGLFFWVTILFRGLRGQLHSDHMGNMPWLFFFSALSIPAFYGVGLLAHPGSHFTTTDFWRFWVVHLWVEDFLELFTTIMVAYVFVLLGVVHERVALTMIYLDMLLYSAGGVIGTLAAARTGGLRRPAIFATMVFLVDGAATALTPYLGGEAGAAAALFTVGAANGLGNVTFLTVLQKWAPPAMLGRIMSAIMVCALGSFPLSVVITGVLVRHLGPTPFFPIAGALVVVTMLGALTQREFRMFGAAGRSGSDDGAAGTREVGVIVGDTTGRSA